jgi:hypothetical protein
MARVKGWRAGLRKRTGGKSRTAAERSAAKHRLNAARGLLIGILLSAAIWGVTIVIVAFFEHHHHVAQH